MGFEKNGDRVTVSAEMSASAWSELQLGLGVAVGSAFQISPKMGWQLIEFINALHAGNPDYDEYEIPADRSQPFLKRRARAAP